MFKQLVTNTTATLIALAVAPATDSQNVGKKISMRAISFSLRTVAVLAMALAFQGLTTAPAGASTLAACLTPGGALTNLALGQDPARPCHMNDTLVVWEEAEPASACPCDIRGMAGWAGWTGPACIASFTSEDQFSARLFADDDTPRTGVFADPVFGFGCRTLNDAGEEVDIDDLDAVEVAACLADLNDLGFSLGRQDGCAF